MIINIVLWFFSVMFLLSGIGNLAHSIMFGLALIIIGLLMNPRFSKFLNAGYFNLTIGQKCIIGILLIIVGSFFLPSPDVPVVKNQNPIPAIASSTILPTPTHILSSTIIPTPTKTPTAVPTAIPTIAPTSTPIPTATPIPTTKPTPIPTNPPKETSNTKTVFITKTGSKYHSSGCGYLKESSISIDINSAKARGLTACSKCNP